MRFARATATIAAGYVMGELKHRFMLTMLLLLFALPRPADAEGIVIRGHPTVVTGDTLDFDGRQVRLFDVDAPEID